MVINPLSGMAFKKNQEGFEKTATTLREEILANHPIRQFRCNLAELILANSEKIKFGEN